MNSDIMYSFIVYRKEMALKLAIFITIGLLLLFVSNYFLNNKILSLFFLIVVIAPIFLIKLVMKRFTRKIAIDLKEKLFCISVNITGEIPERYLEYYLKEVLDYSIQFPNRRFSSIKLNLKNGKSVEYSFLQQKQQEGQESTDEILKRIHLLIENYNQSKSGEEKILLKPSFFASKGGLFCIVGLCALFLIAICLHVLHQTKSLPIILFFGAALIIQLVLKRKSDINIYKKWANNPH